MNNEGLVKKIENEISSLIVKKLLNCVKRQIKRFRQLSLSQKEPWLGLKVMKLD